MNLGRISAAAIAACLCVASASINNSVADQTAVAVDATSTQAIISNVQTQYASNSESKTSNSTSSQSSSSSSSQSQSQQQKTTQSQKQSQTQTPGSQQQSQTQSPQSQQQSQIQFSQPTEIQPDTDMPAPETSAIAEIDETTSMTDLTSNDTIRVDDTVPLTSTTTAENDMIVVIPEINDSNNTTSFTINVFDDTNDKNHTKNINIGSGYTLTIKGVGDSTGYETTITTNANGTASIDKIPAGQYIVTFNGSTGNSKKYMDVTSHTVTLKANVGMTMSLYTAEVSERYMLSFAFCEFKNGSPNSNIKYAVNGATITIKNNTTGHSYTGKSDATGFVRFNNIDEGSYTWTVTSMPNGYTAAVSTGSISGITSTGAKTMNIPTYMTAMDDLKVRIKIEPWIETAMTDADKSLINFSLCKYDTSAKTYVTFKDYTYDEMTNGITETIPGNERSSTWYLRITNTEECGYAMNSAPLADISDPSTSGTYTFSPAQPKVITNEITITGEANREFIIYRNDIDLKHEKCIITKTNTDGEVTVSVPYGNFFIEDTTTGSAKLISVKEKDHTQLIEMPSDEECYVSRYILCDMYGNEIERGTGSTLDDIKKPYNQGDETCLYMITVECGNPYSRISTAIARYAIRIYGDGTVEPLSSNEIGDGNGDNMFTEADLVALQDFLLNKDPHGCPVWKNIDLNCDDQLDVFDMCLAKRLFTETKMSKSSKTASHPAA